MDYAESAKVADFIDQGMNSCCTSFNVTISGMYLNKMTLGIKKRGCRSEQRVVAARAPRPFVRLHFVRVLEICHVIFVFRRIL